MQQGNLLLQMLSFRAFGLIRCLPSATLTYLAVWSTDLFRAMMKEVMIRLRPSEHGAVGQRDFSGLEAVKACLAGWPALAQERSLGTTTTARQTSCTATAGPSAPVGPHPPEAGGGGP